MPGLIGILGEPGGIGVRLDSGVEQGGQVAGQFDSMMAKLIVTGPDRATAIARARRPSAASPLGETTVEKADVGVGCPGGRPSHPPAQNCYPA